LTASSGPDAAFVTINVGSNNEQKRFVVHEDLLTHYSKFFRAALKGGFKEANERIIPLGEQSPRLFELFVHWLYYQRFPATEHNDDQEIIRLFQDSKHVPNMYNSVETLIKLHVFADQYDVEKLMQATVDELYCHVLDTKVNMCMPATSIEYAFDHLRTTTPMCRLLVDIATFLDMNWNKKSIDMRPITSVPFLKLVWQKYREGGGDHPGTDLSYSDFCNYHEHSDQAEREICAKETAAKFKGRCARMR
jgi:hypothetical protein